MQILKVLRGCVVAYLVGSLAGWLYFWGVLSDGTIMSFYDHVTGVGVSLFFGLPVAVVASVFIVLVWTAFCVEHVKVHWWWAPVISTLLVFGTAVATSQNMAQIAPFSLYLGIISGAAFWLGTFGLNRVELIEFRDHALAEA